MASNYTENYALCQWEPTDQVQRTDFNADNAKLDAALAALDSGKADQSALNALSSTVSSLSANVTANLTKLTFGTYVGNGASTRTISLGVTPKAVLVFTSFGATYSEEYAGDHWGGLALTNSPVQVRNGGNETAVKIVTGGFQVASGLAANGMDRMSSNNTSVFYFYIAFS